MVDDLTIGQVQWHCSEEDGGPDVGILLRLDNDHYLWLGELIAAEGNSSGVVVYGPDDARHVAELTYEDLREVFEDYIAPALRAAQGTSAFGQDAQRLEGEAPQARSPLGDAP